MRLSKSAAALIGACLAINTAICNPCSAADLPEPTAAGAAVSQPASPTGMADVKEEGKRTLNRKAPLALILAGGGARGAAHIGVLKVLDDEGIRPDFIAGSSMGALIGALYASGLSGREIEQIALSGDLKKAFFPIPLRLKSALYFPKYWLLRTVLIHPDMGIYSGKSLARFMDKHLPANVRNFEDAKIPMAVTATNLVDTRPVWLTKGSIGTAVRASCSVPMLYRPVEQNGGELVDGGIRENLPTQVAEAAGAPIVLAVKLHSYLQKVPKKEFDTTFDFLDRLTSIFMAEIERNAVAAADVLVEPQVEYMKLRSFKTADLVKAIAAGETAARENLPKLKKALRTEATASGPATAQ